MTDHDCTYCAEDIRTGTESDGHGIFSVEGLPFCCLRHCDLWKFEQGMPLDPRPIRELHIPSEDRVESGPVRFAYTDGRKDWAGLFLRGDYSLYLANMLSHVLEDPKVKDSIVESHSEFLYGVLQGLVDTLRSPDEGPRNDD